MREVNTIKTRPSIKYIIAGFLFLTVIVCCIHCGPQDTKKDLSSETARTSHYLNLSDTTKYVGIETCRLCHQEIYNSFIKTGMGKSFDVASKKKSSARFDQGNLYDKFSDFYYHAFWQGDSMKIMEYRLDGKDTIHKRTETVNYIIGSGQHTNSHIFNTNGFLCQMPMTFYTQDGHWDMPPGFEDGANSRFSRKIGLECMTCHNAYPKFIAGSENKYAEVPNGINCERCHGPGGEHVRQKSMGIRVDTTREIDYSIVNPAKLPIDLQFDVCQRCHLQGNTVLKDSKSFYDFKPGMKLSDVMTVFLPKYSGAEKDFIMASHADRLKMSQCFIKSFKPTEKSNNLRPYKDALTCVTCHNPHVSVKETGIETFNNACKNCHGGKVSMTCTEKPETRNLKQDNCVSCHMPKSGSIDIPHVRVTDHFIRKPVSDAEISKVKTFLGLFAINESNPSPSVKAQAYLNQYEKFSMNSVLLDSAKKYLPDDEQHFKNNFSLLVRLAYLKNDMEAIIKYAKRFGIEELLKKTLTETSLSNDDAWTSYRLGEAYSKTDEKFIAYSFYFNANRLSPHNPEFQNKQGAVMVALGKANEAKLVFENILKENPKFVPALTNLGYLYLSSGNSEKAKELYTYGLILDPDNEALLMNIAGFYIGIGNKKEGIKTLERIIKKHPDNIHAKSILEKLNCKG